MKIRNGFVSNSSTSSFIIYGANVGDTSAATGADRDAIEVKAKAAGLDVEYGPEGDHMYIGLSWDSIGVDETGGQFMRKVEAKAKEVLGTDAKCSTHSEAWYNG